MNNDDFDTPLQGKVVKCVSPDHCAAVRDADGILSGVDKSARDADELNRLAEVLEKYDCAEGAKDLRTRAQTAR